MSKSLIVYDSVFGNTRLIALAIGKGLATNATNVEVKAIGEVDSSAIEGVTLLVVGSPTRGFRATPAIMEWIKSLPGNALASMKAAAFDTRIPEATLKKNWFLRLLGPMVKYAVDPIAKDLQARGVRGEIPKSWFYVAESEGPLLDGELDRARAWGKGLI